MKVGVLVPQEGADLQTVIEHARLAESLGFDSVWVEDHLRVIAVPPGSPAWEAWTTLTAVAVATSTVRCGPLVLAEAFRNPALLASAAATLDHLSDGRLNLGIGAGGYRAEYASFGYPWLDGPERAERLNEALEVLTGMWEGRTFAGRWYSGDGTEDCPRPLQRPRPPIWIGGRGDALLRVAARHADAWNAPLLRPDDVATRAARLKTYAADLGRPAPEITYYGPVWIDEDGDRVASRVAKAKASENRNARLYGETVLAGTPEQVLPRLREYGEAGVTHFVCHFGRADVTAGTELFARAVMPALRG
jgi:alkanesulfonate monooxygenase SsuD/methylene tetrahydromethanopterin reductase-like flavin-dependent oxidoreductase (luciferase family)